MVCSPHSRPSPEPLRGRGEPAAGGRVCRGPGERVTPPRPPPHTGRPCSEPPRSRTVSPASSEGAAGLRRSFSELRFLGKRLRVISLRPGPVLYPLTEFRRVPIRKNPALPPCPPAPRNLVYSHPEPSLPTLWSLNGRRLVPHRAVLGDTSWVSCSLARAWGRPHPTGEGPAPHDRPPLRGPYGPRPWVPPTSALCL